MAKLKLLQWSIGGKTQSVTKLKLSLNSNYDKTQIVKKCNCDKFLWWQNTSNLIRTTQQPDEMNSGQPFFDLAMFDS